MWFATVPGLHTRSGTASCLPIAATEFNGESVDVSGRRQCTEHTALEAMLPPSADDVARLLARWDAGSVSGFAARTNATAAGLGMHHTHYADPACLANAARAGLQPRRILFRASPGFGGERSASAPLRPAPETSAVRWYVVRSSDRAAASG